MIVAAIILAATIISVPPTEFAIQQYSAESENAALYVLPRTSVDAPDIVILDKTTLTVYRGKSGTPTLVHTIPRNTLLFDLYDSDGDALPELFILTPNEVRHYPATNNQTTVQLFPVDPPLPWTVDQSFLHPLIFNYNDAHLVAVPYQNNITLKSFDGKIISTLSKTLSDVHSLFSIPIEPNQLASDDAFEFRVDTLLITPITVPQELRPSILPQKFTTVSPRQLRDSEQLEFELWPSFPLRPTSDASIKVIYASYAPEHVHTVIRIKKKQPRNLPNSTEAYRFSPKRIYPGTIGISDSGLPDFNNDGYHDLLLWKIPIPGHSIASLLNSIQSQTWPIEMTTHLYNPQKGLYNARPEGRIKTTVALKYILTRQSQSPLRNLSFADLDDDGNSDITFSPRPNQVATWIYNPTLEDIPDYAAEFEGPVSLVTLSPSETPDQGRSILFKGKRSIYRINLP